MTDRAPRRWSLRRQIRVSSLVVAVTLLVLSAVAVTASALFAASGNEVIYRWQRASSAGQRTLADLVNQETSIRGYALTGRAEFLQPYTAFRAQQQVDNDRLTSLIGNDARLRRLHSEFEDAADKWQRLIAVPQIARIRAGAELGAADLATGKASFDTIRVKSETLTNALASRSEQARARRSLYGWMAAASALLVAIVITAAGVGVWRGLRSSVLVPIEKLREQTRRVAAGATRREIVVDGPVELTDLGRDVEAMRLQITSQLVEAERAREELVRRGEELARSNDDLQQFAYVASHDLSEPLRKVANFCQLLERQYGDQLDDRAKQYIDFAVDGAKRMQVLIADLLELSRVGRTTDQFERIDLDLKLDQALSGLDDRIAQSGARVERLTRLPVVDGDRILLVSLLENLVGNAIKYHRDGVPPVVTVYAKLDTETHMWTITVSDNGIGIDPQYADRIFAVFQRLHLRDQYGGTGIGLSLCRKIVEFHGGQIWLAPVESRQGATFRFTIPESRRRAESRD